jgi:hypothetical protein
LWRDREREREREKERTLRHRGGDGVVRVWRRSACGGWLRRRSTGVGRMEEQAPKAEHQHRAREWGGGGGQVAQEGGSRSEEAAGQCARAAEAAR